MRIAVIIEHVHRRGGQERVIAELVSRLGERHEVHLFCFKAEDLPPERVRVHLLPCPWRRGALQSLWMTLLSTLVVRPGRFDVVLSQGGNSLVGNFTLIHTCHGLRVDEAGGAIGRVWRTVRAAWATWMEGRAVRRCRGRVIAVSGKVRDYLVSQHGLRPSEITVAHNGVDHAVFNPEMVARERAAMRAELGFEPEDFVILFVGGLWFNKGLHYLTEALGLMEHQRARLVVVGGGDVKLFGKLAETYGVGDRVTFCPPSRQVERYFAAADCFCLLSQSEGFGLVTAEAAACGLPVVTTRAGAADELLEDGVSGFLVSHSPPLVADRLDRLAADPALRERMGQAAHESVRELTWEAQADKIEGLFVAWQQGRLKGGAGEVPEEEAQTKPSTERRVRLAVISHSCIVPMNQGLYEKLAQFEDLELLLVTPLRWFSALSGWQSFAALPGVAGFARPLPVHLAGKINLHWYVRRLRQVMEEFRPDVLLLDEEPYSFVARQGRKLARAPGGKLIIVTKQNLPRRYPAIMDLTWWQVLRGADHALVVSPECEPTLRRRGYRGPVSVLPHGIDPEVFAPEPQPRLRQRLGLEGLVVGYVGRLTEAKGVLDLVEAAARARQSDCPQFRLLLVGDGPLREEIKRLAEEKLGPGGAVLVSSVPHELVHEYMNLLDVLVMPSQTTPDWKEQFGRVLVEALACGVPVIGSSSGHIPALIEETGGGLVFQERDVNDLGEKIRRLLGDPQLREQLAQRGRQGVLEKYTWQACAEELRRIVLEVAGKE